MQDLEIIERANSKAVQAAIPAEVAGGKFVVAKYSGLNFVDYAAYATERERNAAAIEWTNASPGNRAEPHSPTN